MLQCFRNAFLYSGQPYYFLPLPNPATMQQISYLSGVNVALNRNNTNIRLHHHQQRLSPGYGSPQVHPPCNLPLRTPHLREGQTPNTQYPIPNTQYPSASSAPPRGKYPQTAEDFSVCHFPMRFLLLRQLTAGSHSIRLYQASGVIIKWGKAVPSHKYKGLSIRSGRKGDHHPQT